MTDQVKINRGLKGIYFERSGVSYIDSSKGELSYLGYFIHNLATHSTFEEFAFLLISGELPTKLNFLSLTLCLNLLECHQKMSRESSMP